MADKIDDIDDNAARLAAEVQEATAHNKRGRTAGKGSILAAAGIFAVAGCIIVYLFVAGSNQSNPVIQDTATPDDFQTAEGSPFGNLAAPRREIVTEMDTSQTDALREQLAEMQAELARLRAEPNVEVEPVIEQATSGNDDALNAVQNRIDELTAQMEENAKQQERLLAEKDRQLAQMQAALDAAQLQGLAAAPGLDEAQTRRDAAQALFERRVNSPMIAFGGNSGGGGAAQDGAASEGAAGAGANESAQSRKLSANEQFAREAGSPAKVEQAQLIVNPANTVIQGTMIQAVLETFINSDLPGQIRAVVSEDVHSYDGTRVLIPRGSKVIGKYSDKIESGQRRAFVVWDRVIMPDNQSVQLAGIGGDAVGQAGIGGRVNNHIGSRLGGAMLITMLSIAPVLAVDKATDGNQSSGSSNDDASQDLAESTAENITNALSPAMADVLDRQPTITVAQGAEVTIMVDRDLEIF